LVLIILFCITGLVHAGDNLSFHGYFKHFSIVFDQSITPRGMPVSEPLAGVASNRLRLTLEATPVSWFAAKLAYDLAPRITDPAFTDELFLFSPAEAGRFRLVDFDDRLYPRDTDEVGSFVVLHNIDRAYAQFRPAFGDITLGRQAIAWGSSRVVSPTDVLVPFGVTDLDREERFGIDALRMRIPLGALSELDVGYVAGEEMRWERSAAYVRGRWWLWSTDIAPLVAAVRGQLLLGLDLTRSIGGFGTWLEAAYVFNNVVSDEDRLPDDDYVRGTVGADYSITAKLYGFAEYHFSSAGTATPRDFFSVLRSPAFTDGGVFLVGRHYIIPGATYQFTALLSGALQLLYNVSDTSVLLSPSIEYNIRTDVYLSLGAFVGFGEEADRREGLGSEFGGVYPDQYYGSFGFYF
jgi:hypothetical protein